MLFGQKNKDSVSDPDLIKSEKSGPNIFDTSTEHFENDVLKASMDGPVVVDFWAPWCGPCKQLGPILESAIEATKGAVRMAKVNLDENPDLAQALRVQSIPTVFVFFQGQPVTAFTGVKSQSEIKALMDQLSKMQQKSKPDAINIPETLQQASAALLEGYNETAQNLYMEILEQDENNAPAYAGLVRSFIKQGHLEQAATMLEDTPDSIKPHADIAAATTALELAQAAQNASGNLGPLQEQCEKNPDDHQARFDYAMALFTSEQHEQAIDQMLEILRRDKNSPEKWQEDKARLQLLKFFEALGAMHPLSSAGRRKLSAVIFS